MANFFKNSRSAPSGTGATDLYECPAGRVAIVLNCQIANIVNTTEEIDVWWTDSSNADAVTRLGKNVVIPAKAAYSAIVGKLVLEAGDKIRIQQINSGSNFQATASVLEIA
jgi:hypothetical protein